MIGPLGFGAYFRQIARLLPSAADHVGDRRPIVHDAAWGRCGCCPICGDFIYVELDDRDDAVVCPRCRSPIDHLDPLG